MSFCMAALYGSEGLIMGACSQQHTCLSLHSVQSVSQLFGKLEQKNTASAAWMAPCPPFLAALMLATPGLLLGLPTRYIYSIVCILYLLFIYVLLVCIIYLLYVFIYQLYVFIIVTFFGHKILTFIRLKKHSYFLTYHICLWCCLVDNKPVKGPPGCPAHF